MKTIYIAGPYSGPGGGHDYRSYFDISRNIIEGSELAARLISLGYGVFSPHNHSNHFEVVVPHVPSEFWYEMDLTFLAACDAALFMPRWRESRGARDIELPWCQKNDKPYFFSVEELLERMPPDLHAVKLVGSPEESINAINRRH